VKQTILLVLMLSAGSLVAQENNPPSGAGQDNSKATKGATTVRGCVSRSNGDFVLIKQNPAITYELHSAGKVKVGRYIGQEVEVTGKQSPSLNTSSDALEGRDPSPLTLTVTSIKSISKECTERLVSDK
jgi:hypothetical protein